MTTHTQARELTLKQLIQDWKNWTELSCEKLDKTESGDWEYGKPEYMENTKKMKTIADKYEDWSIPFIRRLGIWERIPEKYQHQMMWENDMAEGKPEWTYWPNSPWLKVYNRKMD